jgi:pimeloyl-ACP methyl ester carboxylesterase
MKEFLFEARDIYYRKNEFEPNRPTLVFVHGLSGSSSAWKKYEERFEKKYNILTFDLRGHGASARPKEYSAYKIELVADDLFELLKHLRIEHCILISHSFGSLTALSFIEDHPGIAEAAILLSPHYNVNEIKTSKLAKPFLNATLSILDLISFKPKKGGHVDYGRFVNSGDWNIRRMIADVGNTGLRIYLYCTKQAYNFNGEPSIGKINIPILIIHGTKDTIFPVRGAKSMAEKIAGSEIVIMDKADHILVLNHEGTISPIIENFVGKIHPDAPVKIV